MNLEALQAFIAVVDHGSLLAASEALNVPRTTLRRRVEDLEARAGVALMHRTAQGIVLTEGGQLVVDQGRRMLREAASLLDAARELGRDPSGRLRVVAPPGLPPHLVVGLVAATRARFPSLSLDVRLSLDPLQGLLGDVDLALQIGDLLPDGPWKAFVLHRVPERLLASSTWLDAHGRPECLADLDGLPIFAWAAPDRAGCDLPLRAGGFYTVEPTLTSPDIHLLHHCALMSQGLALVPDAVVPDPLFHDVVLEPVLPDLVGRTLAVRLVVPEAVASLPRVRALVEALREVAEALPPHPGV